MTSMLDASTGARLVGVIEDHREANGLGVLAISHDEILLRHWCDEIYRL
jgi:peptide/nickel transport system ATP-binding protein